MTTVLFAQGGAISTVTATSPNPLDDSGWELVAHMSNNGGMFDGNGELMPGYSYGTFNPNPVASTPDFQRAFPVVADKILFITGDLSIWGIADYGDLRALIDAQGSVFSPNVAFETGVGGVISNTTGNVLSRFGAPEDPWISVDGDHSAGINNQRIVWGENDYGAGTHQALKNNHGGINVYVKADKEAPTAVADEPYTVNEGGSVVLNGSGSSDPDGNSLTYAWDLDNDGAFDDATGVSHSFSAAGRDGPDTQTIRLRVNDGTVNSVSDTATVTIDNVAPALSNISGDTIDENGTATVSGDITDPGTEDTLTLVIDWGEGTPESFSYPAGTTSFSENHQYLDDNPTGTASDDYTIGLSLTDKDGGNGTGLTTVTVNNVAPAVGTVSVPTDPIVDINDQPVTGVSAPFTDPGTADTHTCTVDYDDGSGPRLGTVSAGSCAGPDHTYAESGVYEVTVEVTDDDTDVGSATATEFIVIYDPSGGFVTGGGWIDSPAGAYKPDENLTGKANFGIVSKYKKGASVPTGNTQFQFKAGDLNFHSSSYEWLVVAGNKAQFKGEGTINGEGSYRFKIWADDDNPDTFRIHIWGDTGGTAYDNGSQQALGGGNIKVHN